MKQTEKTSYQYGQEACRNGTPCVPACDDAFASAKLTGKQHEQRVRDLKAWLSGWTDENLKD